MTETEHTITGTTRWMRSDHVRKEGNVRCVCCPNEPSHVFAYKLDVPDEPGTHFLKSDRPNVDEWLYSLYSDKDVAPEGSTVEVTVKITPPRHLPYIAGIAEGGGSFHISDGRTLSFNTTRGEVRHGTITRYLEPSITTDGYSAWALCETCGQRLVKDLTTFHGGEWQHVEKPKLAQAHEVSPPKVRDFG